MARSCPPTRTPATLPRPGPAQCRREWQPRVARRSCGAASRTASGRSYRAPSRSRADRLRAIARRHADTIRRFLDHLPDGLLHFEETGVALEPQRPRPLEGNVDHTFHAPGPRAHDDDPIGEKHGFVDLVGDEEDGLASLAPDLEQLGLHVFAGLCIKRGEWL